MAEGAGVLGARRKCLKIADEIEAWNVFDETSFRLIFVGHVHVPLILGRRCPHPVSATSYPVEYGQALPLDPEDQYIVSVPPVGYARDAFRLPRYAIFDEGNQTLEMRAVAGTLLRF